MNAASQERGQTVVFVVDDNVHKSCRRDFTTKIVREKSNDHIIRKTTTPHVCFVKGIVCKSDSQVQDRLYEEEGKKRSRVVCTASTLNIQKTLLGIPVMRGAMTGLMIYP